jgi:hypothetical protein
LAISSALKRRMSGIVRVREHRVCVAPVRRRGKASRGSPPRARPRFGTRCDHDLGRGLRSAGERREGGSERERPWPVSKPWLPLQSPALRAAASSRSWL